MPGCRSGSDNVGSSASPDFAEDIKPKLEILHHRFADEHGIAAQSLAAVDLALEQLEPY